MVIHGLMSAERVMWLCVALHCCRVVGAACSLRSAVFELQLSSFFEHIAIMPLKQVIDAMATAV